MTPEQFYEAYGPIRENEPPPKDLIKYPNAFQSGKGLMQYNWVQRCDTKEPYQLMQILHSGVRFTEHVFGDHSTLFLYNEIEPIPLTPEILEKCGFVGTIYTGEDYIFVNGSFTFLLAHKHLYFDWKVISKNIKSLHQLQNLYFALTGEELQYQP